MIKTRVPRNALFAIIAALALVPGLWAVDRATRNCGDGLCGFFPGLIVVGGLFIATLLFVMRGLNCQETPRWLFILPWLVWLAVAGPLLV